MFNLSYRQWQKRNSEAFHSLPKAQQPQLRQQGYKNRGWANVRQSWQLLTATFDTSRMNDVSRQVVWSELDKETAGMTHIQKAEYALDRMKKRFNQLQENYQ